jgi:cystathionine gamma-lyase
MNNSKLGFSTKAIHAGERPDIDNGSAGDVVSPIHLASTYVQRGVGVPVKGYEYSRMGNPTRAALETKLATLENAKYGLAFSSGLAAETTVLLSLLKSGDRIIAFDDLYGGTKRLINNVFDKYKIGVTYVDATDVEQVEKAISPDVKMIWLEVPSNPTLKIADIKAISRIAHSHNLIVVVDNTFLSPYFQRPLNLGADIIVHSVTKYIAGHSDVIGGAVLVNDDQLHERLLFHQNSVGAILSPFDSYLTMRGLKTLAVRMDRHQQNALAVAEFLEKHPKVKRVLYPGLKSHPQYDLMLNQTSGFGGVLSFELDGSGNDAERFLGKLHLFSLAESLGGVESLIELPAKMTHVSIDPDIRAKIGITDTLIRISVGIENIEDLVLDLSNALG